MRTKLLPPFILLMLVLAACGSNLEPETKFHASIDESSCLPVNSSNGVEYSFKHFFSSDSIPTDEYGATYENDSISAYYSI